ncbi:hypothetical protein NliqN6_5923 [Naganishia liquefaciens]|jgi:hypothetical protein|uniref:Uncharacterized protein n=1 Tax=Naganishia liquefaciens TaxID=104408 RepID=A0A8H3TXQ9_9TREE|nr:hypothetical protein NliqN6_5923 [Naganishia liquefaciens]
MFVISSWSLTTQQNLLRFLFCQTLSIGCFKAVLFCDFKPCFPDPSIAIRNNRASPSTALVKVTLTNGAVRLSTEPETPKLASGLGRVNLERSIKPSGNSEVAKASGLLEGRPLRTGGAADISVMIPGNMAPFKVTLV